MRRKYDLRGEGSLPKKPDSDSRDRAERGLLLFLKNIFPAVWPLLLYVGVELFIASAAHVLFYGNLSHAEFSRQKMSIYTTIGVIVTFWILHRYSRKQGSTFFEDASLYRKDLSFIKSAGCILFGIGASLAISAVITLLPSVGPVAAYETKLAHIYTSWSLLLSVAFNTFFTPLVEEVIFRGYMLNRLLPHIGEGRALFIVTFFFAILHGSSLWILYAFAMGWLIGKLSILEDNIFYPVMLHVGFNLPAAVLWFIYIHFPGSEQALSENHFLVFTLGMMGAAAALLCFRLYREERGSRLVSRFFEGIKLPSGRSHS